MGVNLRSSLNHFPQGLQHFWIGLAAIGVRVLFLIPQTDCNNFRPIWGDQGQFVPEPLLLSKQRRRIWFSSVLLNSATLLAFRRMETLRANMTTSSIVVAD